MKLKKLTENQLTTRKEMAKCFTALLIVNLLIYALLVFATTQSKQEWEVLSNHLVFFLLSSILFTSLLVATLLEYYSEKDCLFASVSLGLFGVLGILIWIFYPFNVLNTPIWIVLFFVCIGASVAFWLIHARNNKTQTDDEE